MQVTLANVAQDNLGGVRGSINEDLMQDMVHEAFGINRDVGIEANESIDEVESREHGLHE
ncbi:uncharacterized protein G2W53_040168 [Senna tora]|uniref:Uncharacterized protein n=1 Tax=Senna tora TaxID=362788 RepID=A0A834SUI3_9FABA|nr:uncharacterized protein G2W53_040168 [Senna tora]